MKIFNEIIGNLYQDKQWAEKLHKADIEYVDLDQWTAQKSRFITKSDKGNEYAVSLKRHTPLVNGDILDFSTENNKAIVIRIDLKPVLVIDLGGIANLDKDIIINRCIEIGHAIGNQHWPAVVKGTKVYVPLTVDRKVMLSVMDTHSIEGITYSFQEGQEIIPYLLPHEIRRLFGATGPDSNTHTHAHHVHDHDHDHDHSHDGNHSHTH